MTWSLTTTPLALSGFVILLGVVFFLINRRQRFMQRLIKAATAMLEGDYNRKVDELPRGKLRQLGRTLNQLGAQWTKQLDLIEQDRTKLEAILSGMIEGVVAIGHQNRILFYNQTAQQLLNIPPHIEETANLVEVVRIPELNEMIKEVRHRDKVVQREIFAYQNQEELFLSSHAAPIDLKEAKGVVLVFHDITPLRRLEKIRKTFVDNASHELKTPLTAIKGYVDTLLESSTTDSATQAHFLSQIDKNVDRLINLTNDLLSLTKIESGKMSQHYTVLDIVPIVTEAVSRHHQRIKQQRLELKLLLEMEKDRAILVKSDSQTLHQLLDNLIDNAIKFTHAGGTIRVRVYCQANRAILEVADTGIGIPEHELERIFERFYQVDKSRDRSQMGTGLGLAIVKHLVQGMKGEVKVESSVGKGSQFTVSLPLSVKD